MDYGPPRVQGQDDRGWTNGTGGDMPTGYRPCPFCHAVIPWESERCPSCGRVLVERVGLPGFSKTPSSSAPSARPASRWSAGVGLLLARMRHTTAQAGWCPWTGIHSASRDTWTTTSRGTSWSVFQPIRHPVRSWWQGSIPAPTEQERQILFVASALMVILFLAALLGVKR